MAKNYLSNKNFTKVIEIFMCAFLCFCVCVISALWKILKNETIR